MDFSAVIAEELKLEVWRVAKALELMDQGGTIPFIARYRKDQTGTLNEIELRDISHRRDYLQELVDRKETILKSIEEQGKLTPELKAQIEACKDKTLLEDIYAPFKPKKRTRATIAKELGLEPLARLMWAQENTGNTAEEIARIYLSEEKGLADPKAALKGAADILAEEVADNAEYRQYLRNKVAVTSRIRSSSTTLSGSRISKICARTLGNACSSRAWKAKCASSSRTPLKKKLSRCSPRTSRTFCSPLRQATRLCSLSTRASVRAARSLCSTRTASSWITASSSRMNRGTTRPVPQFI